MFSPVVTLPSGGYIVINPTEALVSIDVNSGRSTKEHNIEDTALQTNLEAAEEVARQLRLRDLAGLIVIDFIDMMENRSNRAVERKLKDCLKDDRARIQVGRISHFGLMEMSRQRIRFGVVESSTHKCPICEGTGLVRSTESLALMIMRHIEDHVLRKQGQSINVRVPTEVALYILNFKRDTLSVLEARNNLSITITADGKMTGHQFQIERGEARVASYADQRVASHVRVDSAVIEDIDEEEVEAEAEELETVGEAEARAPEGDSEGGNGRRRRRRRRRGGDRGEDRGPRPANGDAVAAEGDEADEGEDAGTEEGVAAAPEGDADGEPRRRRRRGRRGGRRNRRDNELEANGSEDAAGAEAADEPAEAVHGVSAPAEAIVAEVDVNAAPAEAAPAAEEKPRRSRRKKVIESAESTPVEAAPVDATAAEEPTAEPAAEDKPKRKPRARKPKAETAEAAPVAEVTETAPAPAPEAAVEDAPAKPRRAKKELPPEGVVVTSSSAPAAEEETSEGEPDKKKKVGWWQRRLGLG